jgi:hypothetical protein
MAAPPLVAQFPVMLLEVNCGYTLDKFWRNVRWVGKVNELGFFFCVVLGLGGLMSFYYNEGYSLRESQIRDYVYYVIHRSFVTSVH